MPASNVNAQFHNIIEDLWADEKPLIIENDWNNGFDWDSVMGDLFDEEGIFEDPNAFEDDDGTLWLSWESGGMIYIASLESSDVVWKVQSIIKDETAVLAEPHLIQDNAGKFWMAYSTEPKTGYQGPAPSSAPELNLTNNSGINQTAPPKLIYVTYSSDCIAWNTPICITPTNSSFQFSNPWLCYAQYKYWLVWDSNRHGDDQDLEISYSSDGLSW
ncbi:MAG: hypothetical protein JSV49_02660, partial [Thermoplasmata archaeon]